MNDSIQQGRYEDALRAATQKESENFWHSVPKEVCEDETLQKVYEAFGSYLSKLSVIQGTSEQQYAERSKLRIIALGRIHAILEAGVYDWLEEKAKERIDGE